MLCKNCGAQLSENAQFCSYCGTKIETAVPLPVEPSPPETTEKNAKKAQSEGTVRRHSQKAQVRTKKLVKS